MEKWERKAKQRARKRSDKGKLLRGNRWIMLRHLLSQKRYHRAMTLREEDDNGRDGDGGSN